jgi:hypothetical protein
MAQRRSMNQIYEEYQTVSAGQEQTQWLMTNHCHSNRDNGIVFHPFTYKNGFSESETFKNLSFDLSKRAAVVSSLTFLKRRMTLGKEGKKATGFMPS